MAHTRNIPAFFGLYLLFNIGLLTEVVADFSWDQTSLQVTQGDDVTITCTIKNIDQFDVLRVSKQGYEGTHAIADRADIKKQFLETKRYNVSYKYDVGSETATLALSYKGIRGEDAGTINCGKLGEANEAKLDLDVIVPIDRIYIIQKEGDVEREIGEEEEITLVEGKDNGVKCRATVDGSLSPPTVSVTIAGEDKTDLFSVETGSDVIDPNGGLGKNTAETNVSYVNANPSADFNGKTLMCRAETEDGREETASTVLNVQYTPRVTCDKYKHFGIVGERISIKCNVKSNPPSVISWQWMQGGKPEDVKFDEPFEDMREEVTDDEINASLVITDVQSAHFTTYMLTAKNDIGPKTISVSLTQGSPPRKNNAKNSPNDQASQPNNPEVEASTPLTTTARPEVEAPQGVSGRASQGPASSAFSFMGLLALLCYLMGQR